MKQKADLVVVGEISHDPLARRTVQGDAKEDVVTYAIATLRVDEVLAGTTTMKEIPVEFLGDEKIPTARAVVFLRQKKGEGEQGRYRAVNSRGLWTSTSRSPVDTPLAETAPTKPVDDHGAPSGEFGGEFREEFDKNNVRDLDQFIDYVRTV